MRYVLAYLVSGILFALAFCRAIRQANDADARQNALDEVNARGHR